MKKILIIEDEESIRGFLKINLKRNGYEVIEADNGELGVKLALKEKPAIIILDVMLPGIDGFKVCKIIRNEDEKVGIIMLTAKSQLDDKLEGLDNGADDYLTKPFASAELLARLRALIRRGQDKETTSYNYKGLSLNPLTFRLSCKGKEETLCAKEYQIMEALIIHPESIISQDKLLMHVYGYDDGDITTLWVYISYLRKKLKSLGTNITIKSVRNAGYTLEESHD